MSFDVAIWEKMVNLKIQLLRAAVVEDDGTPGAERRRAWHREHLVSLGREKRARLPRGIDTGTTLLAFRPDGSRL